MTAPQYALVAYVGKPVSDFVHELRRELQPEASDVPAHLTILPPRLLSGTESEAIELMESVCGGVQPFSVSMGDVETFMPSTATVFIRVAHGAYRMRELHDRLNTRPLKCDEPWPYMPHLTVFRMYDMASAQHAFLIARQRWDNYGCARSIRVEELTFVRQAPNDRWIDLAPVPLGRSLALT
jgi:2'-5' RNA ligase